jgi:dihydrofolate reductase
MDPEIDFRAIFGQFDTLLLGRKTFEATRTKGGGGGMPGMKVFVFSKTLRQEEYPKVTIVSDDVRNRMLEVKEKPGKDIWLFGGGSLFASLLEAGVVDTVEVAVIPVLLGTGIPLLPPPATNTKLRLSKSRVYETTGTVSLEYNVGS